MDIKTKNTEENRTKLADAVAEKLILVDDIDTDLVFEIFHDMLIFYYEHINKKEFQQEWDRIKHYPNGK